MNKTHYTIRKSPVLIELDPGMDEFVVKREFLRLLTDEVSRALGVDINTTSMLSRLDDDPHLIPLGGFRIEGGPSGDGTILPLRSFRAEEYAAHNASVLVVAERLGLRKIRYTRQDIYTFEFAAFDDRLWNELDAVYEGLPGFLEVRDGLPWWFGRDEQKGPYLSAGVEPPGLDVQSILEPQVFDAWHERFLKETASFPMRDY